MQLSDHTALLFRHCRLVRNSWSATWGEAGYIRLLRHDDDSTVCGTDKTPDDGKKDSISLSLISL
jgi:hypothetical protein